MEFILKNKGKRERRDSFVATEITNYIHANKGNNIQDKLFNIMLLYYCKKYV